MNLFKPNWAEQLIPGPVSEALFHFRGVRNCYDFSSTHINIRVSVTEINQK